MGTHTSQRPPAEVVGEALDYMVYMRHRHFILNMDQTPVYFAMSAKQMLEIVGKKTVHIRTTALGWEFRFGIPISGRAGIRNSASDLGIPMFFRGKKIGKIENCS
jgi:hypothetical protein